MAKHLNYLIILTLFIFISLLFSTFTVGFALNHAEEKNQNPLTPKAFAIHYWNKVIKNNLPKPSFILSKLSPLSAAESVTFSHLASTNNLSTKLPEFCAAAHLLCLLDIDLDNKLGFESYGVTNPFEFYTRGSISFVTYMKSSSTKHVTIGENMGRKFSPGNFFREKMLKQGTVIHMPEIKDKLPKRSFLPRTILNKLPFGFSKLNELKQVFKVVENSSMEKMIEESLIECERVPNRGEIKRCVGSIEDMIDFVTSILGHNVRVHSIENVNGSNKNVMVGQVKRINNEKMTKVVSCHQNLFPYLLYYCHSVPKVRVYETNLLDPETKIKINHGVAICHIDTTTWSPTHDAFLDLGFEPGQIEVCHWIFENDMIWTVVD